MIGLFIVAAALTLAIVASELVLRGMKLQTGFSRVLVVWGFVYIATALSLRAEPDLSAIAFTIFWGGTFLTWFGIRSHIESSILLRMLVLLRPQPMNEAQLISEYLSKYGEVVRINELCRGGLAKRDGGAVSLTTKGQTILRVVAKLR